MKQNLTEMVFVLDRSGSMSGKEQDVIGGFNSLIAKQKKLTGDAFATTVLFDSRYDLLHDHVDLKEMREMTQEEYNVRGCTALLDAVGKTIDSVGARLSETPEEERPEKVIFVIMTDGLENASKQYDLEKVKGMIEHQTNKYSWEFIFLGANIDAVGEATAMGMHGYSARQFSADSDGIARSMRYVDTYSRLSRNVSYCMNSKQIFDSLATPIESMDFSVRTNNILRRANIHDVAELCGKTESELLQIRNLGEEQLEEIKQKLEASGLSLAPEEN